MTKVCKVLLSNEAVTVVRFGDIDVQLPPIRTDEKEVLVEHEGGKYRIVRNALVVTEESVLDEKAESLDETANAEQPKEKRTRKKKPAKEVE